MARQQIRQIITGPVLNSYVDRTYSDLQGIISGAGQAAAAINNSKAQSIRQQTSMEEAQTKLNLAQQQLGLDQQKLEQQQEEQKFRIETQQEQTELRGKIQATQQQERTFKELEDISMAGMTEVISKLSREGKLTNAVAYDFGYIGFRSTNKFNEMVARQKAQDDLPGIKKMLATTPPDQVEQKLDEYVEQVSFANEQQKAIYSLRVNDMLVSELTRASLDDAKLEKQQSIETSARDLRHKFENEFTLLTPEDFASIADGVLDDLQNVNPHATKADAVNFIVESISPLFIGQAKEIPSAVALQKFGEILGPEASAEYDSLNMLQNTIRNQALKEASATQAGNYSVYNELVKAADGHEQLRKIRKEVEQQQELGGLGAGKSRLLLSQIDDKLQEPDTSAQLRQFMIDMAENDTSDIVLDEKFDTRITQTANELGIPLGAARGNYYMSQFGRVPESYVEYMTNTYELASYYEPGSPERAEKAHEALKMYMAIYNSSPSYAEDLSIGDKDVAAGFSAMAKLASTPGQSLEAISATFGSVSQENYNHAHTLMTGTDKKTLDTWTLITEGKTRTQFYRNKMGSDFTKGRDLTSEGQSFFNDMMILSIAQQKQTNPQIDDATAITNAVTFAKRKTAKNFTTVKFGGKRKLFSEGFKGGKPYVISRSKSDEIGWTVNGVRNDSVADGHNDLFNYWLDDLEEEYPMIESIEPAVSRARVVTKDDGSRWVRIPMVVDYTLRADHEESPYIFEAPLSPTAIKSRIEEAKAKL